MSFAPSVSYKESHGTAALKNPRHTKEVLPVPLSCILVSAHAPIAVVNHHSEDDGYTGATSFPRKRESRQKN